MDMGVRVKRGLVVAGLLLGLGLFGLAPILALSGGAVAAPVGVGAGISPNNIVVQGNRRVEADTVRSYFKPGPNGLLDANSIDAALKALYATGLFQDVQISQSGGKLIVTVSEGQIINRVTFEGNHRLKDEQITQEIQSKERGTLSKATVQADVQRILEIYQRNGRFDVTVVPKTIERPNNRVDLIFEINEGEKTGIKHLVFVGNKSYSDWRLKEVIKTAESNWLSFLQTTDVYDPDRIEADRDLIRRFYLKHGYADVQVVSATGVYDPAQKGFTVTFTIEEGPLYHFGSIDIQSNVRAVDAKTLRSYLLMSSGQTYNGESIEKTVEQVTIELARRGYPFGTVRPRGDRNPEARTISVVFVVDEGQRAYIERINIRGNYRTRDYVIRREFDIGEGDPYNRALIDRAERRIKNLNFFKSVKITNEPGSAPDRVVINVDVEENSTGDFSVMGGYSTSDGWLGEVSVQERNLLGTGRFARAAVTYGQYVKGIELDYAEPYFLDYRASLGVDLFAKQTLSNTYISYGTESYGGVLKWSLPLREDLAVQLRYSAYVQNIQLPSTLDNCNNLNPDFVSTFPTLAAIGTVGPNVGAAYPGVNGTNSYVNNANGGIQSNCLADGEASLPVRAELANGQTFTSAPGYGIVYNSLDNNKNPTNGMYFNFGQDFAGAGGDTSYLKTVVDFRTYYEIVSDLVGIVHLQAGTMTGFNKCPSDAVCAGGTNGYVRMLDDFKMGPNLVRGFEPAGIGPRDITFGATDDNIGGTHYWGASLEFQYPFYFLPKDSGFRGAVFADAGSVWGYRGETQLLTTGEVNGIVNAGTAISNFAFACQCGMPYNDSAFVRTSVGASLIWDSPFGPLRFDFAYPITKGPYDRTQWFAFGGGAKF
ncbi:MAG TPA: outer membrane protein assembly factor BamA [Xanthobacteraceae bacterium]|jgi:outer membrane protein insertion porin family|nr:outer membrane protein assembly factor BamA [Xanthobacteraceae bacterium]